MTSPAEQPHQHDPEEDFAVPIGPMTFEEFLAFDDASDRPHEFVDGFAYAMSPVRSVHSRIAVNVAARVWMAARGTRCEPYQEPFQVRTPDGRAFCPDVMASCGRRPANDDIYIDDPCLIVEVLSRGTARIDHGEKRVSYQKIRTLRAYLIVESTWRAVHRHYRDARGRWKQELIAGPNAVVPFPCPGDGALALTLDEIYERVDLPNEPPHRPQLRRVREPAGEYVVTAAGYEWVEYADEEDAAPAPGDA